MKCYRLFHKAKFLTQLTTELSFGKSEACAALIDRLCTALSLLGVCSAKGLLFFICLSLWQTPCQPWQLKRLLSVMPLTEISSHPPFPAGSVKQLFGSQVISQPLLPVSLRWCSCNPYLAVRTFLYQCPYLPQQEELPNPVLSAMEKPLANTSGRRHFFSSYKSELLLGGALSMPANLECLSTLYWGWG